MIYATIKKFADADRQTQTDGKTHRHRSSNSSLDIYIGHLCYHETLNLFNVLHIIAFCHTQSNNLLLLKLKKMTSGLLKNLEQNKLLLNLENFTSHCLKNPEIWLVLLIGPLLIRTYCVYEKVWEVYKYKLFFWKIG